MRSHSHGRALHHTRCSNLCTHPRLALKQLTSTVLLFSGDLFVSVSVFPFSNLCFCLSRFRLVLCLSRHLQQSTSPSLRSLRWCLVSKTKPPSLALRAPPSWCVASLAFLPFQRSALRPPTSLPLHSSPPFFSARGVHATAIHASAFFFRWGVQGPKLTASLQFDFFYDFGLLFDTCFSYPCFFFCRCITLAYTHSYLTFHRGVRVLPLNTKGDVLKVPSPLRCPETCKRSGGVKEEVHKTERQAKEGRHPCNTQSRSATSREEPTPPPTHTQTNTQTCWCPLTALMVVGDFG